MKELFTKLLLAEATVGAVALVLVELLPRQLIALFGAANESVYYTDFAVKSFRIYLCMIILACVNKACFIFLQAMGKAAESTALSMVREVVFGVGFALLLPRFFGLDGVLYSMPMSDILTFLIAGYLICKTYRELSTKRRSLMEKHIIIIESLFIISGSLRADSAKHRPSAFRYAGERQFLSMEIFLPSRSSSSTQPISMLSAVTTKGELLGEAKKTVDSLPPGRHSYGLGTAH